jgi:hypothetical protein
MTKHEGNGRAKRRDLRQRQIDKDDLAREDLDTKVSVDTDEARRH